MILRVKHFFFKESLFKSRVDCSALRRNLKHRPPLRLPLVRQFTSTRASLTHRWYQNCTQEACIATARGGPGSEDSAELEAASHFWTTHPPSNGCARASLSPCCCTRCAASARSYELPAV